MHDFADNHSISTLLDLLIVTLQRPYIENKSKKFKFLNNIFEISYGNVWSQQISNLCFIKRLDEGTSLTLKSNKQRSLKERKKGEEQKKGKENSPFYNLLNEKKR